MTSGRYTPNTPKAIPGLAAAMIAAAAVTVPMLDHFEGTVLHPYKDVGGYETVCNGERFVAMRVYTKAECDAMTSDVLAKQYLPEVAACTPNIIGNRFFFGVAGDAAWNGGNGGYCHSPMAKLFKAGKFKAACEAFKTWHATVHHVPNRGLKNRRDYDPMSEYHTCLKGLK